MFGEILQKSGPENLYTIRQELRSLMDHNMGVFRTGEGIRAAQKGVGELKERYRKIGVADKGRVYNTDLLTALEMEYLLICAEAAVEGRPGAGGVARRPRPPGLRRAG